MTWYELLILWLNLLGALVAFVVSVWAARVGTPTLRPLHTAVATLSAIYVGGYAWFLAEQPGVELWSSVFRGVALVVWPVVWVLPALYSVRIARALQRAIAAQREELRP